MISLFNLWYHSAYYTYDIIGTSIPLPPISPPLCPGLMRLFSTFFPTFRLSFFPTLASEEDCHVPFYWLAHVRTWSCGRFLLKSRASGPCAVPWHMSASFSEGSQISGLTCAVSVRRDWRLQDNGRAEDRLATKRCDVDTNPLPARHITFNDYSPAIRWRDVECAVQWHSIYQSDCGLSTDDNYAACLSPSHGSQSVLHAQWRRRSDLWKAFAEIASLDFLCRLLWFDLLFSVEY